MSALPAADAAADMPPAPPQTGRRRTEPSMDERAFFNNKCFKIIKARRVERAAFCTHSRSRQAAAGLSQPLVTVPPGSAPNVPPTKKPRPRLAAGQLLLKVAEGGILASRKAVAAFKFKGASGTRSRRST